jgi:hypothetical protein
MAMLAVTATSMRSAGIICVAVTLLYPLLDWFLRARREMPKKSDRLVIALGLGALITVAYYGTIQAIAPEKGVATTGGHSYTQQFLWGLTDDYTIPYYNVPKLAWNLWNICLPHFDTFGQMFCPLQREDVAPNIPRMGIYNVLARVLFVMAIGGWLFDLFVRRRGRSRFVALYVLFYIALYSIWPFDYVRFWVPILPLLLAYMWETIGGSPVHIGRAARRIAPPLGVVMCLLLVTLNCQELYLKLPYFQRRLSYVSECLTGVTTAIRKDGGDPQRDVVASGDMFLYAYYTRFPQAKLPPPDPRKLGPDVCRSETLFVLKLIAQPAADGGKRRVYIPAYFPPEFYGRLISDITAALPADYQIRRIYQQEMVTLWAIEPR